MYSARTTFSVASLVMSMMLGGCASPPQIADQAIKANLSVEQAHNQILLLNVVRAYHRRPLYFTGFTGINGPIGTGRPSFSLATPFGPDFKTNIYTLTTGFAPDVPSFQTGIYDGQEFIRGLMTPISPKLAQFFLDQGWPQELILHLFVREIVVVDDDDDVKKRYTNYPPNEGLFKSFQEQVKELSTCELVVDTSVTKKQYGPDVPSHKLQDAEKLAAAKSAEFTIDAVENQDAHRKSLPSDFYRLSRIRQEVVFKLRDRKSPDQKCLGIGSDQEQRVHQGAMVSTDEKSLRQAHRALNAVSKDQDKRELSKRFAIFTLRSPEAMLYYLGELARVENEPEYGSRPIPVIGFDYPRNYKPEPLFVLRKNPGQSGTAAAVQVEYEGDAYAIPENGGRSMHVLSLVQQLIGLHKKAADLPATTTVRILP
jgi:hypothetical protein